jgi:hypothetical protein
MTVNFSGLLLAGTLWLLAAVLAWPLDRPNIAAWLLIGQAVGFVALAVWSSFAASRPPSGRDPRTGKWRP